MKKLLFIALAAFALAVSGCDPESNIEGGNTSNLESEIVGTWYTNHDNLTMAKGTFEYSIDLEKYSGTYTLQKDVITFTTTKSWSREYERTPDGAIKYDAAGNYMFTDWQESESGSIMPFFISNALVSTLYDGKVLLFKVNQSGEETPSGQQETNVFPFVNAEKGGPSDISLVQGQWDWMSETWGEMSIPRARVTVKGDELELIITPWCERYVGKAEYKNGIIVCKRFTWYTTRGDDGGFGTYSETEDPSTWPWRIPGEEAWISPSFEEVSFLFIPNGKEAYGIVAGLPSVFTKK